MDENNVVDLQSREQLQNDRKLAKLLCLMPKNIQDSFTDEQLKSLKVAITASSGKQHAIDFRSSISFFSYRYYYLLIAGRDLREMSRQERHVKRLFFISFLSLFLVFSTLLGILVLYLIKSALGIDIFPHFSFGVWGWFRSLF